MKTDHMIRTTAKRGRTETYHEEDNGWTQTGPTGHVLRLRGGQLLSHLLAPIAADQPGLRVEVQQR